MFVPDDTAGKWRGAERRPLPALSFWDRSHIPHNARLVLTDFRMSYEVNQRATKVCGLQLQPQPPHPRMSTFGTGPSAFPNPYPTPGLRASPRPADLQKHL